MGDETHIGSTQLATSLVASLQLIISGSIWGWVVYSGTETTLQYMMPTILSFSAGALIANVISVILLIVETTIISKK